jgi:hypothetical protein
MTTRRFHTTLCRVLLVAAAVTTGWLSTPALSPARAAEVRPPQEFGQQASWQAPDPAAVRRSMVAWLAEQKLADAVKTQAEALWPEQPAEATPEELLSRTAATFSIVDAQVKPLIELCRRARSQVVLPEFPWLTATGEPGWERSNLRLLYGRWLAHERLYDEALTQLEGLKPEDVADPASLLFYQGVVYHHMLSKEPGAAALERLLEQADHLPRRYVSVARLILSDLKGLEDDSLDHIARRMQDIQRRLDLGRGGRKVRDVEDGVIASLDKIIDEIEKQQAAAVAAAAGAGGGNMRPSQPAPDSRIMPGKGPGLVDRKPLGNKSGWGDLPPKQRQEALQQIGKDYPAHYRDLIEEYFRKLATEDTPVER